MICANCETETAQTPCVGCGDDSLLAGKYQLERILGRGAQGTTFLATGPDGICAVKELQLGRATGGKATELFHREAAVLDQLSHDNIPDLYDHFVDGVGVARSLYVVQQFISGTNLEERLNTHRFTEEEVRGILGQLAEILEYLHSLSPPVIHRDIKPSNLILDDDGQLHLVDFGAVRDVMRDSVGGGSTVAGTFGYMAPEQLVGDATPQSDLYALGMTAIRLLTRQHPTALADRMGNMEWRSQANVSEPFAAWIDSLVQLDANERPQTARPPHSLINGTTDTGPSVPNTTGQTAPQQLPAQTRLVVESRPVGEFFDRMLGRQAKVATLVVDRQLVPADLATITTQIRSRFPSAGRVSFTKKQPTKPQSKELNSPQVIHIPHIARSDGSSLAVDCVTAEDESHIHVYQRHRIGTAGTAALLLMAWFVGAYGILITFGDSIGMLMVAIFSLILAPTALVHLGRRRANLDDSSQSAMRVVQSIEASFTPPPNTDAEASLPREQQHPTPVERDLSKHRPKTRT